MILLPTIGGFSHNSENCCGGGGGGGGRGGGRELPKRCGSQTALAKEEKSILRLQGCHCNIDCCR